MKKYLKTDEWNIIEDNFHADHLRMSESVFSLGNGRFGQRGNFEEPYSSDCYRGSFVAADSFSGQHTRRMVEKRFSSFLYTHAQCSRLELYQNTPY